MLVFVQSIERAKELFHELVYDGMNVDVIHSERKMLSKGARLVDTNIHLVVLVIWDIMD